MSVDPEQLVPIVDQGLGNSSWLLALGDGRALAVDPPRDLRALRAAATARGLTVAYAAETHLHADFLSGARQLAATDGATILASAAGQRGFAHQGLADGDEVDLGGLTLRALATPGHTQEHLSLLLLDGATPQGVFTGGSLIVGSAARTDLVGEENTEALAYAQYASLHRLAQLPAATWVWPTHGAGSYCSAPAGGERSSTIGAEIAGNPLLAAPDAASFAARLIGSLGSYPRYFDVLAEVNRRGPTVLTSEPALPALPAGEVRRLAGDGAVVLDVRPVPEVAAGHLPGSLAIPLREQFASWLGWLLEPDTPVVIVRNPEQHPASILWPALNIGYERLLGELAGGVAGWAAHGGELARVRLLGPEQLDGGPVLDVRQADEYRGGHVPGSLHVELGELPERAGELEPEPAVVVCAHGERSIGAATLLARAGRREPAVVYGGGAPEWAEATGGRLATG